MSTLRIAIVTGSTRPGRNNEAVARWVERLAQQRTDALFELVDIANYQLPLFDEPMSPMFGKFTKPHTQAWAEKIASFDGYVFVTPEYNHSIPGALKNAIDFLYREWNNKAPASSVTAEVPAEPRAVEHLRLVMSELMVATVRPGAALARHRLRAIHQLQAAAAARSRRHCDARPGRLVGRRVEGGARPARGRSVRRGVGRRPLSWRRAQ